MALRIKKISSLETTRRRIGENGLSIEGKRSERQCETMGSSAIAYELKGCQSGGLGARQDFSEQCQTPTILLWLERNFSQELTKAEGHK